jgi:L-seryl-tRNA(Ser) seleniumtransferase
LGYEPLVQDSVKAGAQLVTFSGDKLLGGPQAGMIVGTKDFVDKCKSNPIARAVRLDKLTLAALVETLKLYQEPDRAVHEIPTLIAITRSPADVKAQASRLATRIRRVVGPQVEVKVLKSLSEVGGGSLPGQTLPSWSVTLRSEGISADDISRHFRLNTTPIFGRIENDLFMLDMRTVAPVEAAVIVECVRMLLRR